jgi:hypothetical protein
MRSWPAAIVALSAGACSSRTPAPPLAVSISRPSTAMSAPTPVRPIAGQPVVAYATETSVCTRAIASAGAAASCIASKERAVDLVWRNVDELVALTETGRVSILRGASVTELPTPPPKTWDVPRPSRYDPKLLGKSERKKLVVGADGDIWLGRCAWAFQVDSPDCASWVFARLNGPLVVRFDEPRPAEPAYGSPPVQAAPADVRLEVSRANAAGARPEVRCTSEGGGSSVFEPPSNESSSISLDVTWVAPGDRLYLVEIRRDFIETETNERLLFKACEPKSIRTIDGEIVWGPGGLWGETRSESEVHIWNGAAEVARLQGRMLTFRPPH